MSSTNSQNKTSVSKNFIYQIIYTLVVFLLPLILAPYLTRTLGSTGLGNYTYANSIAYYFVLFANLGIAKFGQRTIAACKKNEIELRKKFWSLFYSHMIFSLLSLLLYLFFCCFCVSDNKTLFFIIGLYVISACFDVTWLFYGIGNFRIVTTINIIVKLFEVTSIFLFVKKQSDLSVYALIVSLSYLIIGITHFVCATITVKSIKVTLLEIIKNIGPILYFSISVLAVSLYTIFDKTLLGLLSTKENVAFYEYANKIVSIPCTLLGIIGTVLFPTICSLVSENKNEEAKKYINNSILIVSFFSFAFIFGLLGIGNELVWIYYGDEFKNTGNILKCMTPLIYIVSLGDIIRTQYMIPYHKDKPYIICVCCNAVINIIVSLTLIPILDVYGAIIGTICAELFGLVFQLIYSKNKISICTIIKQSMPLLLIGLFMMFAILLLNKVVYGTIFSVVIKILFGTIVYFGLSSLYIFAISKEKKKYIDFIKTILKHNKNKKGDI